MLLFCSLWNSKSTCRADGTRVFWVVEDEHGRWHPDSGALDFAVRRYMLLKFPVPEAGEAAKQILEHEALYQRVARRMGLRVTQHLPEYVDGALLIPRFDRRYMNGTEIRLGVESSTRSPA